MKFGSLKATWMTSENRMGIYFYESRSWSMSSVRSAVKHRNPGTASNFEGP